MEHVCLAFAILIQGAFAVVDGCIADPNNARVCHDKDPVHDATSLLQHQQLKTLDRAQDGLAPAKTAVIAVPKGYDEAVFLKSRHDDKCLDYNFNDDNVYMHTCHGGKNQQWYFKNNQLVAQHATREGKCLDAKQDEDGNVYMFKCHGGDNQKWRLEEDGSFKTDARSDDCLDYKQDGSANVYMYKCHGRKNQQWYFDFAPVDCKLSDWGEWTTCSRTCGDGKRSRSRTVTTEPQHGGKDCGTTEASEACNVASCPVDCKLSDWEEWTTCSQTCGDGKRSRSRTVTTEPQHGGKDCGTTEASEACNVASCPVDCKLSVWGEWTTCSQTCGDGQRSRSRAVTTEPNHGGKACSATEDVETCSGGPRCPELLKSRQNNACLDYATTGENKGNVYRHACHGGSNQKWYVDVDNTLKSEFDGKCLDYHAGNGNVYMHKCHGGKNQRWIVDETLKTQLSSTKCLDASGDKKQNVYMYDCHGKVNQKWYFAP